MRAAAATPGLISREAQRITDVMQSGPTARPFRLSALAMVPLIFAVALIAFGPSIGGGVLWDDPAHLTTPELESWSGLWRILTQIGATQEYYPVLHGAFWVEHRLWGDYLPAYHLLNIALQAGSACLLALILRRLWTRPATSPLHAADREIPVGTEWFAAALFAVHPVAVESVAWITEQKNTLSVFFYLLAAALYLRFDGGRRARDYVLAIGVFVLALGAKTATITLPAALLVILWWRRGRIAWRRDVLPLVPWFVLALIAGLVTVKVETNFVGAKGAAYALTLTERLLLAPRIVWFYVGRNIWPHDLLFFYPRWNVPAEAAGWWGYALATIAVTAGLAAWAWRRGVRGPLAAWLLFLGAMFPVIGFFNVFAFIFSYVADHFEYMPCLMFVAAATCGAGMAVKALPAAVRKGVPVLGVAVVVAFAAESNQLSRLYVDNATLFGHVVARNPSSWMAHQILGSAYVKTGRLDAAIAQYREVIRLKPDHPDAYEGLAFALGKKPGGRAASLAGYEQAIRLRPQYLEAHYNLGLALAEEPGRRADAIAHLRVAAGLQPQFIAAQDALGGLLARDPATLPEAFTHFETALRYQPNSAETHRGYADALARAHRLADAIAEYGTALRLDPQDALAESHVADVLAAQAGRQDEAIGHYRRALQLDPHLAEAHAHFAGLLARDPARQADAIAQAQTAVQLDSHNVDAHNLLGILYVQRGDADGARREWQAALAIDPRYPDARRNLDLLERMLRQRAAR